MIYDSFRLHDQDGLPLSFQQDLCRTMGLEINYAAFACDALSAGWTEQRVEQVITEARPDIEWKEFRARLATLWTLCGSLPDPECWDVMAQRCGAAP